MDQITCKKIEDIQPYQGPHAIPGIRFRALREALGVTAWGMNVLELDPGCEGYPEHDHVQDGQEEVYLVLEGSIVLRALDTEIVLTRGDAARVPHGVKRKLVTRESGATILAIGATPGKVFEARL